MELTEGAQRQMETHSSPFLGQNYCLCVVNLTRLLSLSFPLGWLHPEHGVSTLFGAGGEQTVTVQFPAGSSGLHRSEMDHH